jgi:hypothetical protein
VVEGCEPNLVVMSSITGGDKLMMFTPVADDSAAMKAPLSIELCRTDVTSIDVLLHVTLTLYNRLNVESD